MILADNTGHSFKLILIWILLFVFLSCDQSNQQQEKSYFLEIQGVAQGTTFSIIYQELSNRDLSPEIDSILNEYDMELSLYEDSSLISAFNHKDQTPYCLNEQSNYFKNCFLMAKEVYNLTNGAFNPAIYPLVQYWGFYESSMINPKVDSKEIDSLLNLISFSDSAFFIDSDTVFCKSVMYSKLDFNGIAQGHSVDAIADYFDKIDVKNYFIEIGGEVSVKGINPEGDSWKIGIDRPIDNSTPGSNDFQMIIALQDLSLATSGNYRKFYKKDGVKYSHTIDPETGYPVQHSVLSVTVIHAEAAYADAYATAFMVMGVERSRKFINSNKELGINAYFVYSIKKDENKIWMSDGMNDYIVD